MDYESHKKVYDITDRAYRIQSKMQVLSHLVDPHHDMPNSLQSVLGKIYRYEGSTQRDIARIYQIDYKNVIRYISDLEHRGLVKKELLDAKRKGIYLTDKGREVIEFLLEARRDIMEAVLRMVSDEDLEITKRTLDLMIDQVASKVKALEDEMEGK